MIRVFSAVIFACLSAAQALASPCVSATFDQPFPGATQVTSYVTDVPSSMFPAFWQEGRVDGFAYKLFANGTAVVTGEDSGETWRLDVVCSDAAQTCTISQSGPTPEAAMQVAKQMGQCLIPTWGANDEAQPQRETPLSQDIDEVAQNDEPIEEESAVECGLALVSGTVEIAKMQELLILLGADPGPVDGFLGPQTFAAMAPFIEDPGWETPISDALVTLSDLHCQRFADVL